MGEIEAVARIVLRQPAVLATWAVAAVLLATLTLVAGRRGRWDRRRTTWGLLAAVGWALVPAVTLAREGWMLGRGLHCGWSVGLSFAGPDSALNVVMLMPAVFCTVVATGRPVVTVLIAVAVSASIELVQAIGGAGVCQVSDLEHNAAGGLLAGALAWALLVARERPARARPGSASRR